MSEKQQPTPENSSEEDAQQEHINALLEEHGNTWSSPNDPADPYNWPTHVKISIAIIVSFGQLVTLMSASMMAAALDEIGTALGMGSSETQIAFSIYFLGIAFAPFLVAALSEMYGRKPIWVVGNGWYILWNALCPVGHSRGVMIFGRFMAASGASVGVTLTAPILTDLYRPEHRGKSLAIATFIPYLGPALGPIIGGIITQHLRWEWLFWILSIFEAGITIVGIVFFAETYTPTLLRRKGKPQHESFLSSPVIYSKIFYQNLSSRLKIALLRPLLLLVHRPVILVISFIMALNFSIYSLMLSTYATLWIEKYDESPTISSLNYISIAIGSTISSQGGGHLMDYTYRRLRDRNNGTTTPEYRVPFLIPGVILVPAGLFWYGWTAQQHLHWVLVDIGVAICACGSFVVAQGMTAYLMDEFKHAASANAAARMFSYVLGFAFPIFAPALYNRLGYGWGNSLLAFIFLGLGTPMPLILWVWGSRLRAVGRNK